MGDSERRFNGFMKDKLLTQLEDDLLRHYIFNERDLHSTVYFHVRRFFELRDSANSENIFVRCEPSFRDGTRPDVVVYNMYDPIYVIEMKMFKAQEKIDIDGIEKDLKKLKKYWERYDKIKWGFFIMVYDSEFVVDDLSLRKFGFHNISLLPINMRRNHKSGRLRVGYTGWREQFDKFLEWHA